MLNIIFYINDELISINNTSYCSYINIVIIIDNKTYTIGKDIVWYFTSPTSNNENYINYTYGKFFDIICGSGYSIAKNNNKKVRKIISLPSKFYNTLYAFFIYNKYYTIYKNFKNYNIIDNSVIYSYKLFNCRDFYRIFTFI
jgi:hypothetical protein